MKKEWFFDRYCGHLMVALLEDGELTEFAAETEKNGDLVGNVYKGVVKNVLSGMQVRLYRAVSKKTVIYPPTRRSPIIRSTTALPRNKLRCA